jgi:hypothetical protein
VSNEASSTQVLVEHLLRDVAGPVETTTIVDGYTAHAVVEPGRTIPPSGQERIYSALVPVTSSAFGADMTEYWRDRRENHYFDRLAEFDLVEDESGRMVGWSGHSVLETDRFVNCYVDSTGLAPSVQSAGLMRKVLRWRICERFVPASADRDRVYLSARSESPIFYKLLRGLLDGEELYPSPKSGPPADVRECAEHLAGWLGQRDLLEGDSLVLRNAYAVLDELYGELPSTGDAAIDRMFRDPIGPLDAYLLVGRVRRPEGV